MAPAVEQPTGLGFHTASFHLEKTGAGYGLAAGEVHKTTAAPWGKDPPRPCPLYAES